MIFKYLKQLHISTALKLKLFCSLNSEGYLSLSDTVIANTWHSCFKTK